MHWSSPVGKKEAGGKQHSTVMKVWIMEVGESEICRVGWQPGDPGEPTVQMRSENSLLEDSLLLEEASLFVLVRPSAELKAICLLRVYLFKC